MAISPWARRLLPMLCAFAFLLTGCSGSSSLLVNHTPQVTGTAGHSTAPLPGTVPLPNRAVLVQEYSATLNGKTGTAWLYTVIGNGETPASVITFYQTNMPTNGWTTVAVPPESAQGKYGGTAIAYQQGGQYAAIAAGVNTQYPRAVVLLITIAP
ncbi:MAG: hypothetical protein H0X24_21375 [Ktedonobacterales bacterium]|nr:hypothetical protein [Ktedonobacterales bacterium]